MASPSRKRAAAGLPGDPARDADLDFTPPSKVAKFPVPDLREDARRLLAHVSEIVDTTTDEGPLSGIADILRGIIALNPSVVPASVSSQATLAKNEAIAAVAAPCKTLQRQVSEAFEKPAAIFAGECLFGKSGEEAWCIRFERTKSSFLARVFRQGSESAHSQEFDGKRTTIELNLMDGSGSIRGQLQDGKFVGTFEPDVDAACKTVLHLNLNHLRIRPCAELPLGDRDGNIVLQRCGSLMDNLLTSSEFQVAIEQFTAWKQKIQALSKETGAITKKEHRVLFIGSSGVGKSKLLSLLVGEEELLPSAGQGSAVTAAPIELHDKGIDRNEPTATNLYKVEIELLETKQYKRMLTDHCRALVDYWNDVTDSEQILKRKPPLEQDALSARSAHDWLEAVHGRSLFEPDTGRWKTEDTFKRAVENLPLVLSSSCGHPLIFETNFSSEVANILREKLVETQSGGQQSWPLVKKAIVRGPWPNLYRASLVDLPGFGDVNAVRNQIAEEYYRNADLVVVLARIDRAATDKKSLEWLYRVLRDLPSGNSLYVCTKADDVAKNELIRSYNLPRDTSKMTAAIERNRRVKIDVCKNASGLNEHNVFTVSAQDGAFHLGFGASKPNTFMSLESTELPRLLERLHDVLFKRRHDDRLSVARSFRAQLQIMDSQLTERPGCSFDANVWQSQLDEAVRHLEKSLQVAAMADGPVAKFLELEEAINAAGRVGEKYLPRKARAWGDKPLHHCRSKALVDKDGIHDDMDIPADLGAPVFQELDRDWVAAFDNIPNSIIEMQKQMLNEVKVCVHDFSSKFDFQPSVPEHVKRLGMSQIEGMKSSIGALGTAAIKELQQARFGYAQDVQKDIQAELRDALRNGSKLVSGAGAKQRRMQAIAQDVQSMTLASSLGTTHQRAAAAKNIVKKAAKAMTDEVCQQFRACYRDVWNEHGPKAAQIREQRAALRGIVVPLLARVGEQVQKLECDETAP